MRRRDAGQGLGEILKILTWPGNESMVGAVSTPRKLPNYKAGQWCPPPPTPASLEVPLVRIAFHEMGKWLYTCQGWAKPSLLWDFPTGTFRLRGQERPSLCQEDSIPQSCCCQSAWSPPSPGIHTPHSKHQTLLGPRASVERVEGEYFQCWDSQPLVLLP